MFDSNMCVLNRCHHPARRSWRRPTGDDGIELDGILEVGIELVGILEEGTELLGVELLGIELDGLDEVGE